MITFLGTGGGVKISDSHHLWYTVNSRIALAELLPLMAKYTPPFIKSDYN